MLTSEVYHIKSLSLKKFPKPNYLAVKYKCTYILKVQNPWIFICRYALKVYLKSELLKIVEKTYLSTSYSPKDCQRNKHSEMLFACGKDEEDMRFSFIFNDLGNGFITISWICPRLMKYMEHEFK